MNLNKAMLIGNVTRDPEVRTTPQGQSVVSFSVATNFSWTDAAGKRQDKAEYHNIVAWRKLAEIIGQYVKKGSKIYVEGRMQTREWEGQDGKKNYRTEIIADNMIMLDSKRAGTTSGPSSSQGGYEQPASSHDLPTIQTEVPAASNASDEINIEEIPF